jgi:hypothetical protein
MVDIPLRASSSRIAVWNSSNVHEVVIGIWKKRDANHKYGNFMVCTHNTW